MARVKKGVNAHKRHKKILKMAKGYYGQKSKVFRAANPAVMVGVVGSSPIERTILRP